MQQVPVMVLFYNRKIQYRTEMDINDHKDEHYRPAQHWDNVCLADELKSTYDYILTTIHETPLLNSIQNEPGTWNLLETKINRKKPA